MKAHQRIVREQKETEDKSRQGIFCNYLTNPDLKTAMVKRVNYETAKKIIEEYEWLKTMPAVSKYYFGIFFEDYCGGVVVFGDEYTENLGVWDKYNFTGKILLLSRGACLWWTPIGSASKLIMQAIKMLPSKFEIITATVDSLAGEVGTIYQACNFYYVGVMREAKEREGYLINGKIVGSRNIRAKIGNQKMGNILKLYPKAIKVKQVSKARYFYFRGSKRTIKENIKQIKYLIKPYPKRNAVEVSREIRTKTISEGLGQFQETALSGRDRNNS